jgi:hypothetical protein
MFQITPNGPNRVDVEFGGKLDAGAMKAGIEDLISKTQDVQNGRMLYRVGDLQWPTFSATIVEFWRLPAMLRLIGKFDRVAVVADQHWVNTISEFKGALIPGLDIKGFDPDQAAEAEAWLTEA